MPTLELEKSVTFQNIVVATDFSSASQRAFEYAANIAGDNDAQLYVLHASPPEVRLPVPLDPLPASLDPELVDARENLRKLSESEAIKHLRHEEIVERGTVWDVVKDIAEKKSADLVVVGTHGRTGLRKLVLGSVAEEIFRGAGCPVLTVGPCATAIRPIRRVLFATDFDPASVHALPYAIDFANRADGELVLLHLTQPIPVEYVGPAWYPSSDFVDREEMDKQEFLPKLAQLLPSHEGLKCSVKYVVETHYPAEGIVGYAKAMNADLIVVGIRQYGKSSPQIASHMPWAIAYEVVCSAECPVLTVRR
ncbi:MAG TPA: universal stress protein [Terriglobales bacterium]|jgi:nucleotide-binding universal stress UspA family protein